MEMQAKIADAIGAKDASIFDAHLLVVEDRTLIDEVLRTLEREHRNIESIFRQVANRYANLLEQMDDPYLRERALDIHDVTRRVLMNLAGKQAVTLAEIHYPHILLAHNLSPSDTAQLNREYVLGFATDAGSRTSHTAIMARSLGIPAIVGLHDISTRLETGMEVLLDGYHGLLVLDPTEQTLREYEELARRKQRIEAGLVGLRETASTTADGHHLVLSANIETARGHPDGQDERRGGRGPVPHGIFLSQPVRPARRGGAVRELPAGGQRHPAAPDHHPHARPGRRQVHRRSELASRNSIRSWAAARSGSAWSGRRFLRCNCAPSCVRARWATSR